MPERSLFDVIPALLRPGGLQDQVEAVLRRKLATDPHDTDALWKLAEVRRRQGNLAAAPVRFRPRPVQGHVAARDPERRRGAAGCASARHPARAVRADDELSGAGTARSSVGGCTAPARTFLPGKSHPAGFCTSGPEGPHHLGSRLAHAFGLPPLVRPEDSKRPAGSLDATADGKPRSIPSRDGNACISHGRILPGSLRPFIRFQSPAMAQFRVLVSPRTPALLRRRSAALR